MHAGRPRFGDRAVVAQSAGFPHPRMAKRRDVPVRRYGGSGPLRFRQRSVGRFQRDLTAMVDSRLFDKRGYPIVGAAHGYGKWAETYEATVAEGLDRPLLERIRSIDWPSVGRAADLACGSGRTGAWLKSRGVQHLDG